MIETENLEIEEVYLDLIQKTSSAEDAAFDSSGRELVACGKVIPSQRVQVLLSR
jgi:hypothetical protein